MPDPSQASAPKPEAADAAAPTPSQLEAAVPVTISPPEPVPPTPDPRVEVAQGLIDYYSAMANAALAQYNNIVHLLGETDDWTAPGTACEVLIRQLARQALPDQFSIDKGFIHGRTAIDEGTQHSPEIDVLIHDSHAYAPLLRMDDFVIVHPAAVRGVVQVKRTMDSGTLQKAMANLLAAKRHIRDCRRGASSHQLEDIFSAFITFADDIAGPKDGTVSKTYENRIKEVFHEYKDGYLMPHFVGSMTRFVFVFDGLNMNRMHYAAYRCLHQEKDAQVSKHMGLQVFLAMMAQSILPSFAPRSFAFPDEYKSVGHFVVWEKPQASPTETSCASTMEGAKPDNSA